MIYLYSMEPPLYRDYNKACRTMDESKFPTLGAYAAVMYMILINGEDSDAKRDDAMKLGEDNGSDGPYGYFSECFTTFRGMKMDDEKWFQGYKDRVG